jgi:hypothetical protein
MARRPERRDDRPVTDRQVLASLPRATEAEAMAERLRGEGFTPEVIRGEALGPWVQVRVPPDELEAAEAFLREQVVASAPNADLACPSCGVVGPAAAPGPVARVLSVFGLRTTRCPACGTRR